MTKESNQAKRVAILLMVIAGYPLSLRRVKVPPADRWRMENSRLHKFEQAIGEETYKVRGKAMDWREGGF